MNSFNVFIPYMAAVIKMTKFGINSQNEDIVRENSFYFFIAFISISRFTLTFY